MKKLFHYLLILCGVLLITVSCNDKDDTDYSLGKAVEGSYLVNFTINDTEVLGSYLNVAKSGENSVVITLLRAVHRPYDTRADVIPEEMIVFSVDVELGGMAGAASFEGSSDNTTVYIGPDSGTGENAKVEIWGMFSHLYGPASSIPGPAHWTECIATITPEDSEPITIYVRDQRYGAIDQTIVGRVEGRYPCRNISLSINGQNADVYGTLYLSKHTSNTVDMIFTANRTSSRANIQVRPQIAIENIELTENDGPIPFGGTRQVELNGFLGIRETVDVTFEGTLSYTGYYIGYSMDFECGFTVGDDEYVITAEADKDLF